MRWAIATRRRVLELVRNNGPAPVGLIAAAMPVSRPAVSQHLRVLEGAGLVTCDEAAGRGTCTRSSRTAWRHFGSGSTDSGTTRWPASSGPQKGVSEG